MLVDLGNIAVDAQRHDAAISLYSAALSLNSVCPEGILIQRSKARVAIGLWQEALEDANKVAVLALYDEFFLTKTLSGYHTRTVFPVGIRNETCGFT